MAPGKGGVERGRPLLVDGAGGIMQMPPGGSGVAGGGLTGVQRRARGFTGCVCGGGGVAGEQGGDGDPQSQGPPLKRVSK